MKETIGMLEAEDLKLRRAESDVEQELTVLNQHVRGVAIASAAVVGAAVLGVTLWSRSRRKPSLLRALETPPPASIARRCLQAALVSFASVLGRRASERALEWTQSQGGLHA
jgi:hypothetical protein